MVRRQIRRQFLGVTKITRATRWIAPVTVGVTGIGGFGLLLWACAKASEGAEKSCLRRRVRGQRKLKSRSRGVKPRRTSETAAPFSREIKDRAISRLSRQADYWVAKRVVITDKLRSYIQQGKPLFHEVMGIRRLPHYVPSLLYLESRDRWAFINKGMSRGSKFVRPLVESFGTMLDSDFSFSPPGTSRGYDQLLGPPHALQEFIEDCRELEVEPNSFNWELYLSSPMRNTFRSPRESKGKKRLVVARAPPLPGGTLKSKPGLKGTR